LTLFAAVSLAEAMGTCAKAGRTGRLTQEIRTHVKLFRTWLKDQPRHYVVFLSDDDQIAAIDRKTLINQHQTLAY